MFRKKFVDLIKIFFVAVMIGASVGILDWVFGIVLLQITEFRYEDFRYLIWFLPLAGLFSVFLYRKWGGVSQKGMSLLFEVEQGSRSDIPVVLIPLVVISTWLTHLFGGSAGREGVAVQIGGVIGCKFSKLAFVRHIDNKIFLIMGMAAGFGGLFQTPFAAAFFAVEVFVVGKLYLEYVVYALISSLVASAVTAWLGLEKFSNMISSNLKIDLSNAWKLVLLAIIFGLVGRIFADGLSRAKSIMVKKFPNPYLRIAVSSAVLVVALFLLHSGRYAGLGTNLISSAFVSDDVYFYDWLFKLILTIITIAIGFQGGEVTPLFAIGATLGSVLGSALGLPTPIGAALGYLSVFGSATSTFFAPILIGVEVFGGNNCLIYIFSMVIARKVSGKKTIYSAQR